MSDGRRLSKTDKKTILSWHSSSRFFSSLVFATVATALLSAWHPRPRTGGGLTAADGWGCGW